MGDSVRNRLSDALTSKLQVFRHAVRRVLILMKLSPVTSDIDSRPPHDLPAGSPKRSKTKRLPSEQEIRAAELSHEYNYPDLSLLKKEVHQPPPPDITTLPRSHAKRKRNGERCGGSQLGRSLSDLCTNSRKYANPRKNVSMKAKLFENPDEESESEEYLYPTPSPKQPEKQFFPPNSKPPLANKPSFLKKSPAHVTAMNNINHVNKARDFLSTNLQRKLEIANKPSPRPWKPQEQQPTNMNNPPDYVDMGNFRDISLSSEKGKPVGTVMLRPVGKVAPSFEEIKTEVQQISSKTNFSDLGVTELVACLRKCGLWEMADVCQAEKLDGAFINELSVKELQEFKLTPLQMVKLNKVKSGWRPVTTQLL
ncbi:uncharacterized protein LOC134232908 [Saccostrea cucullata]|uniref:uncharacterized protein LOC134232908 n=1 Tax=Saccostrea cuccullata TaxID=36930 RepID=UPI002ED488B5